jgi:peptidoglycan/xylan/chitin deacetylase (PgdA/CDA1 family)
MSNLPLARLGLWAYAGAGVTLGARAVLGAPPPLIPTLLGLGGYLALGTVGVFWPERGMYGSPLWRGPKRPEVALTFDDGPNPHTTPRVLAALAAADVKATFFLVGRKAQAHPELVRDIAARGHDIGLHGFDHDRFFSLRGGRHVVDDIRRTQAVIAEAGVPRPTLFRPPIGFVSHFTVWGAGRAGVTLVGCSARALDGFASASVDKVTARLLRALEPGALIAMHDAAERDDYSPASIEALPHVLAELSRQNLRAVTLGSWA